MQLHSQVEGCVVLPYNVFGYVPAELPASALLWEELAPSSLCMIHPDPQS